MNEIDESKPYRKNVAALVRRTDGEVALFLTCHRINPEGAWQMVQGGIEEGEAVETALFRELSEELGVDDLSPFSFVASAPPQRYDFPDGVQWSIAQRYAGQEQTVCLVDFDGDDSLFDLTRDQPPEFSEFKWVTSDDLISGTWSLKRPIVKEAIRYFTSRALL